MPVLSFPVQPAQRVRRHVYRLAFRHDLPVEAQEVLARLRADLDRQRRGILDVRYVRDPLAGDWVVTETWNDDA